MKLRSALLAATVLAAPVAAKAQPVTGLYVSGGVGVNLQQNQTVNAGGIFSGAGFNTRSEPGVTGQASVGYGLGNGLRAELEGFYSWNDLRSIKSSGPTSSSGKNEKAGAFVNLLYDFDLGLPVYPYVGVGAGYVWNHNVINSVGAGGNDALHYDKSTDNFGYQGIAGLSYPLPVPGLSLTAEYRFMGLLDPQPAAGGAVYTYGANGSVSQARGNMKFGNDFNHQILIGVRYAFGVTPPPPPPAPIVAPKPTAARTYLVFFDWDRADLTARAREIVAEAARASTQVQATRIEVNGYTDKSGTPQYNQRLSVRRAQSVAAELVKDGVPRNVIFIHGFGETHPLVPTAQGVREPQNRRVEIILH
ncbi:Outer membrane protein A [Granulibacter bethesdensis]|uniref:Outer membrane protein A n=1 Tax=Granulibacter bethesdensis TaxID=364410 RepID=A0AAN0RC72_9PROT|nr:OmpA family protein [Granulibacter bethesdensis]AHJ62126.1 Outer membrane protein A [Granulibacter bethesdensis]